MGWLCRASQNAAALPVRAAARGRTKPLLSRPGDSLAGMIMAALS